MTYTAEKVWIR